jgi:hypothetical protein
MPAAVFLADARRRRRDIPVTALQLRLREELSKEKHLAGKVPSPRFILLLGVSSYIAPVQTS